MATQGSSSSSGQHLIRLVVVFAAFFIGFLVLRRAVIPKDFGLLGHYRPAALEDNRLRAVKFAGQSECVLCHETQDKDRQAGKHAKVSCEACHGPAAKHADDPGPANKPVITDVAALCTNCHAKDAAKPAWFPQVIPAQHNADAGACNNCHTPHKPKMS